MKSFLLVLLLLFCCSSVFAQSKTKMEQVIMVEITFEENSKYNKEVKIPIDFQAKNNKGFGVGYGAGGSHCEDKSCQWELRGNAWQPKKNKFRVIFTYIYPRKWKSCNFEKIFIVEKNKHVELQAKCEVKLKAYYAKIKKDE